MENIVLYSHLTNLDLIKSVLELQFGKVKEEKTAAGVVSFSVSVDKSFLSKGKTLTFNCRQRTTFDYQLIEIDDAVTSNLAKFSAMLDQMPIENNMDMIHKVKAKLSTCNTEVAVMATPSFHPAFKSAVEFIAKALDAMIFSGKNNLFPTAGNQGFYNKELGFLLDFTGKIGDNDMEIAIESQHFDKILASSGGVAPTPRQHGRKVGAEEMLAQAGIVVSQNLPYLPDAATVTLRTSKEVAERTLALFAVAVKAEGLDGEELSHFATRFDIEAKLTPQEAAFFQNPTPSEEENNYFLWRYETVWTFFWAMGFVESEFSYPAEICNAETIAKTIISLGEEGFVSAAALRDTDTILDQLDLTYRCHWAVVAAAIKQEDAPGGVIPPVVFSRHYALNWLTQYGGDMNWDEVQTPT